MCEVDKIKEKVDQYNRSHTKLLEGWKKKHKDKGRNKFVSDGVVCPEKWFSQTVRPLFLLKEAHAGQDGGETDWNLIGCLNSVEESKGRIWSAVAEWQHALENTTADSIPFFDSWLGDGSKNVNTYRDIKCGLLKKCAVINVKKSNGQKRSDDSDLMNFIEEDWDLLKKQIEIVDPTIILCGSTFHLLIEWQKRNIEKRIFSDNIANFSDEKGCYLIGGKTVIAYYHPSNHYPAALNYYGLAGMYHYYLKEKTF